MMSSSTILLYALGLFALMTGVAIYSAFSTNRAKARYFAALGRETKEAELAPQDSVEVVAPASVAQEIKQSSYSEIAEGFVHVRDDLTKAKFDLEKGDFTSARFRLAKMKRIGKSQPYVFVIPDISWQKLFGRNLTVANVKPSNFSFDVDVTPDRPVAYQDKSKAH